MVVEAFLFVSLSQPRQKSPASDELAALAKADQAVRQFKGNPPPVVWEKIRIGDEAREARVRQLLKEDRVRTKEDLDHAALIFQHGSDPDDYQLARELAILSCAKGAYHSLPALAEDRFLNSIGRKQRFGSQFGWGSDGKPIIKDLDEDGPAAVTDALRLDFLIPGIKAQREKGLQAFQEMSEVIGKRIDQSRDKKFLKDASSTPEGRRVREFFKDSAWKDFDVRIADVVLSFYHRDKLRTPELQYMAAALLFASSEEKMMLLSNELAALSTMRGYGPAKRLFARTWDKYLVIIGRGDRYGTVSGSAKVAPVVSREFLGKG